MNGADLNTAARLHETVAAIVRQSHACHPTWPLATHLDFLAHEEEIDLEAVTAWNGCRTGWHFTTVRETAIAALAAA